MKMSLITNLRGNDIESSNKQFTTHTKTMRKGVFQENNSDIFSALSASLDPQKPSPEKVTAP